MERKEAQRASYQSRMTLRVRNWTLISGVDIHTERIRDFTQTGNRCSFITASHAHSRDM